MFALAVTALAGYGYYRYWKKHRETKGAVTPIAFAQTAQAMSMSLAQDKAAGANVDGVDTQQLAMAYIRGNPQEIAGIITYMMSLNAKYTGAAFQSRAAQVAGHH